MRAAPLQSDPRPRDARRQRGVAGRLPRGADVHCTRAPNDCKSKRPRTRERAPESSRGCRKAVCGDAGDDNVLVPRLVSLADSLVSMIVQLIKPLWGADGTGAGGVGA